ncbi:TlpA disulfide reductase family protein [uncultured Pigmentiphaga sp.]|jgi:Thiol-disulfide isomerase and thioredoxins|uniref:TlpA family protein disulfide reductase n=2 Tax=Pigmentiphaga TaxID=152267 RepID=UPI0026042800|nr:TlpA disulfide reductase family protein [uncultured Pigmentiphaga sp.]
MNHGSSDKRRQLLVYGGLGAAAALAGGVAAWWQLAPRPSSDRAVDILYAQTLEGLDGRSYAFEQWRGRRLVVNFWATWCPPCVEEMPELEALRQEFDGRAQFVGIGIDSATNMQKFVQKVPVSYPLLIAGNVGTELARELGNASGGLPYTVVIDEKGSVLHQYAGRIKAETLRDVLASS